MKKLNSSRNQAIVGYVCIAPAILGLVFLTIIPIFAVVGLSFTDWNALTSPKFIKFENYISIFTKDLFFFKSVAVTIYFAFGAVFSTIVYTFLLALMINREKKLQSFWRTVYFIPYILPAIANAVLWMFLYDPDVGLLNYVLNGLLGFKKSLWIYGSETAIPSLIVMVMWASGNFMVIFLSALQDVPKQYIEAVEIDGGNTWHKFKNVIVPLMTPIIFFNFLTGFIANLQSFIPSFEVTNGGPNDMTLFLVFLIYRESFMHNNFGYGCSIAFVFFIVIALVTAVIFKTSNKWVYYEGGGN